MVPKLTPGDVSCVEESSGTPKNVNGKRFAPDLGKSRERSRRSTKINSSNARQPTRAMQQVRGSSAHGGEPIRHISPQHSAPSYVRTESSSTGPGGHTGLGDVTSQVNTPLPLPEPGNADAWAGHTSVWNTMDGQPLLQPGNIEAWPGSPATWNTIPQPTLPLPQLGDIEAWVGSPATWNTMHEPTLPLPQLGDMGAWAGSPTIWNTIDGPTSPLPQPDGMDTWAESSAMGNVMHELTLSLSEHEKGMQE